MTVQRLHAAMAPIDVLTRVELEEVTTSHMDRLIRDRYRGVDTARFPTIQGVSPGGTFNLSGGGASDGFVGPEQGDVWMMRRAIVSPSVFGDPAKYILFRGSTPSDPGQYTNRQLLDGIVYNGGIANAAIVQPAIPASTVAQQNTNSVPVQVVITGGTATSTSVNGIVVGGGDGTYTVPAYGSISVTYSVAPTWVWTSLQLPSFGQSVGIAYQVGNKAVLFQPGEQLYAQVFGSTAGVTYSLSGEAIRVPAEMKGKVL